MKLFRKNYIYPCCIVFLIILVLPVTQAFAETYQYDADGRLIGVTYDDGSSITYTYDEAGNRLVAQQAAAGPPVAQTPAAAVVAQTPAGGGGCTIGQNTEVDPLFPVLIIGSLFYLIRRRYELKAGLAK